MEVTPSSWSLILGERDTSHLAHTGDEPILESTIGCLARRLLLLVIRPAILALTQVWCSADYSERISLA